MPKEDKQLPPSGDSSVVRANEGEPMTAHEFELLNEDEATELLSSRFCRLTEAGYECTQALVFAVHPQFELDGAEELLADGSSDLAAWLLIQRAA
jgi:hypothetical protein